jgi:hypothetical protein
MPGPAFQQPILNPLFFYFFRGMYKKKSRGICRRTSVNEKMFDFRKTVILCQETWGCDDID